MLVIGAAASVKSLEQSGSTLQPNRTSDTVDCVDEPGVGLPKPGNGEAQRPTCRPTVYNFDDERDLAALADPSFDNNYCAENAEVSNGNLVLKLTAKCGPSIGPSFEFREGKVEARIRTGRTSGVVTSLYLRSGIGPDGSQDEVDIEFVGKDPNRFQSFVWVNGKRGQETPEYHDVGQDTSTDYHVYGIDYQKDSISWLLDGRVVRTLHRQNAAVFPSEKQRFKITLWDGSDYDDWAGPIDKSQYPYHAYFDWIRFTPYC
ncbi:concanavalin A-like lectin/glucanase domain-containing protein [Thamnocephalis sphaerospora]|uniref:Concanavalin A-like lectin/glucanase domain-containing protein n=1 Tax=Thamnocephalis sphaerospora TaxID=78915 RepID=A0A4P9XSS0_9FUNG|nr:concanavalin A-like lectin/glucanase domain-containing protein [Thamnocephalis sphaerospora]|eukprot:RKP09177.1 concanavalin A-like lectin/glucanase domain-containing protein [Thamnocephalis sphaerospora]